jgi:hypothetical protein
MRGREKKPAEGGGRGREAKVEKVRAELEK